MFVVVVIIVALIFHFWEACFITVFIVYLYVIHIFVLFRGCVVSHCTYWMRLFTVLQYKYSACIQLTKFTHFCIHTHTHTHMHTYTFIYMQMYTCLFILMLLSCVLYMYNFININTDYFISRFITRISLLWIMCTYLYSHFRGTPTWSREVYSDYSNGDRHIVSISGSSSPDWVIIIIIIIIIITIKIIRIVYL